MSRCRHGEIIGEACIDCRAEKAERTLDFGNLCDVIAKNRGWHPLVEGETMTIGFSDGTEYVIRRNPDRKTNKP